jgi:rRNA maturation endonuclease Nob1
MMILCYGCGKVFDVMIPSKELQDFPCPACGRIEAVDLGPWERKAIAWREKMNRKARGG